MKLVQPTVITPMLTLMNFLYPVVDVSAQGGCTITPINPTILTAAGGALPSGTENVMILCNCTYGNGTVEDIVRWYDSDEIQLIGSFNPNFIVGTPHYSRLVDGNNTNVILVIPIFNGSYNGTYSCGRKLDNNQLGAPNATVYLTIDGELIVVSRVTCINM